jgi:putative transposase
VPYLAVSSVFAVVWLLPVGEREKDIEILVLRHEVVALQRQLGLVGVWFAPQGRALLAALGARLLRGMLGRLRLLVRPDTVLRWHRDLIRRRHAAGSRCTGPGRPRTIASVHRLMLRLARENGGWGIAGSMVNWRCSASPSRPRRFRSPQSPDSPHCLSPVT